MRTCFHLSLCGGGMRCSMFDMCEVWCVFVCACGVVCNSGAYGIVSDVYTCGGTTVVPYYIVCVCACTWCVGTSSIPYMCSASSGHWKPLFV